MTRIAVIVDTNVVVAGLLTSQADSPVSQILDGMLEPIAATARAPDPGDQFLWDLLAMRDDRLLVTGERRVLRDAGMRGRVIAQREFVERNPDRIG